MASPISQRVAPPLVLLPQGTLGVGTEGNVGIWNAALRAWGDFGTAGGSRLKSLALNQYGQVMGVGVDGNVRTFAGNWGSASTLGNWPLNMLAVRYDRTLWCVGTGGKVGIWGTDRWFDKGNMGGWTLRMLTWNAGAQLVGVGTQGNVGTWNGIGWSGGQGLMGGWTLKMLAFDASGGQWCVGTEGNVGFWNGQSWTDLGNPGGWTLDWLCFT